MKHGKQHYVPESYLKAWCDPETPQGHQPYVWIFSKDGRSFRPRAPTNIFHEQDFYTIKKTDGSRDLVLENGLSELEGRFAVLRQHKLAHKVSLTLEDRVVLCAFTAAMQERTKASREHIRAEYQPILETMNAMREWQRTATPEQVR